MAPKQKPRPSTLLEGQYFEDPIPRRGAGARHKWFDLLQPCLKNPGHFIVIMEYPKDRLGSGRGICSALNKRRTSIPRPTHHWEFAFRTDNSQNPPIGKLYACYHGPEQGEEEEDTD